MTKRRQSQRGFVSILVTMILMVVTSLIVLSFAFLARQNQTRNLNQQLSTQAFYAAESGINDAVAKLHTNSAYTSDNCSQTSQIGDPVIGDSSLNVSYTCVLVNQSPTNLKYDSIGTDTSTIVHIHVNNPGTLQLSWQDATEPAAANSFALDWGQRYYLPQTSVTGSPLVAWVGHTGILRTSVIPTGALDQTRLLNNSRNFFLYPYGPASAGSFGSTSMSAADGSFANGHCSPDNSSPAFPMACNVRISGVGNDFFVRLKSIYRTSAVTIQVLDSSNQPQAIDGAQAVIDATGKAQNVLRRLQVRLPLTPSYYFPEFALESSDTICKRMSVWPNDAAVLTPSDTGESALYTGTNANNPINDAKACALPGQGTPSFP
jgi:hypothetical protein